MKRFHQLLKATKEVQAGMGDLVLDAAFDREKEIVALNTDEQLYDKGIDSDGKKITPGYSLYTVIQKAINNQPFDRVTLRDSGDFHRSFRLVRGPNFFTLDATDVKAVDLQQRYGDEIIGLSDAGRDKVPSIIRPPLIAAVRSKLLP